MAGSRETPKQQVEDIKQVIVIRRDLKMRRGKEIAQGAHASMAFMSELLQEFLDHDNSYFNGCDCTHCEAYNKPSGGPYVETVIEKWIRGSFKKVVLQATDEEELLNVRDAARRLGLRVHLIIDSGLTEFNGIPTNTALAIGPDYSDKIDEITGPDGSIPLRLY